MSRYTAKICILGDFAVGKTSTVARYVHNEFSEKYLTTIGVKIDTKSVTVGDIDLKLVVWDVAGTDTLKAVDYAYLRGASGYVVICDGTRRDTLDAACNLLSQARNKYGNIPAVLLVNKSDLAGNWELTDNDLTDVLLPKGRVYKTSAKTGDNVEAAFGELAAQIIADEFAGTVR